MRLWLGTLTATNNAQYVLLCLLFAFKGPAMPLVLAPLAICSAYQVCVSRIDSVARRVVYCEGFMSQCRRMPVEVAAHWPQGSSAC